MFEPGRLRLAASGLVALSLALPLRAEQGALELTFDKALARARERAPEVLAAAGQLAVQEQLRDEARHRYLPTLSLGLRDMVAHRRQDIPQLTGSTSDNTVIGDLSAQYTLLDFGRRSAALDAALHRVAAQRHSLTGAQVEAALLASELYVLVLADDALIRVSAEHAQQRREVLRGIEALVAKGLRPPIDAARARAELIRAEVEASVRTERAAHDRAVLALTLGYPSKQALALTATPMIQVCDSADEIDRAAERAAREHPQLRAAEAALGEARDAQRLAEAEALPTVDVSAQAAYARSDLLGGHNTSALGRVGSGATIDASIGLSIRWNVFDLTIQDRSAAAGERTRVSSAERARVARERELDSLRSAAEARESTLLLRRATEFDELATLAVTAEIERYRLGEGSLLQLLDAQQLQRDARVDRIDARRMHDTACQRLQLLSQSGVR